MHFERQLNIFYSKIARAFFFVLICFIGSIYNDLNTNIIIASFGASLVLMEMIISINHHRRTYDQLPEIIIWISLFFWFWTEAVTLSFLDEKYTISSFLSPFRGSTIPNNVVSTAFLQISLFQLAIILSLFFFKHVSLPSFSISFISFPKKILGYLLIILAFLGWVTFIINSETLFQSIILFRQSDIEIAEGFSSYFPIVSIAVSGWAFALILCTKYRKSTLVWGAFLLGASLAFFSGTRFKILYIFMPALICFYYINRRAKVNYKTSILFIFFGMLLFGIASFQVVFRYNTNADFEIFGAFQGSGHFTALTNAIGLADTFDEPLKQSMLPLFITDFIPRFIWPGKPDHEYWVIYNYNLSPNFGNVTPSIIGQYYMNWWGFGGLYCGLIIGFVSSFASRRIEIFNKTGNFYNLIIAGFILSFVFLSFRVFSPNYVTYLIIIIILTPITMRYLKIEAK